jgi:hypothetical protein
MTGCRPIWLIQSALELQLYQILGSTRVFQLCSLIIYVHWLGIGRALFVMPELNPDMTRIPKEATHIDTPRGPPTHYNRLVCSKIT